MKIPHPQNPQHVENLVSIPLLEAQGFKGPDADLATSLFEYGLIWRELESEFLFVHRHPSIHNRFDRTLFDKKTAIKKEFDWVDWDAVFACAGTREQEWNKLPLPNKIFDLMNYHGAEEIFGSSYWEGFKVFENNQKEIEPGSYSHGTHRPEDLLPVFFELLKNHNPDRAKELESDYNEATKNPDSIFTAEFLNETMFDALNELCPDGHYFGAHIGDGSDFGVWEYEQE